MAKKIYSSKIIELGDFIAAANMIIMFDEAMALPELRDACVMHTGNQLTGMIETGDVYKISGAEFKILKVGSEVRKNLMNLGHITIKFDGGEKMTIYFFRRDSW
ncbi:MAG: PTS sorbitol transporter subunit IIA [Selenomonadaceae bacterium]|nr:PTS sorbitol transporter subunit IIA [Selenomonadaceae bacterium]